MALKRHLSTLSTAREITLCATLTLIKHAAHRAARSTVLCLRTREASGVKSPAR